MQRFVIHLEPPSLAMGPARGRAAAIASVTVVYVVGLLWLFSAGRLPWQAGARDLGHFVEDFRACVIAFGGVAVVIDQLWVVVGTRSFVLTPESITFHAPLFGRQVVPLAELRHELTLTFVVGRSLYRVLVHPPRGGTFSIAGGPDDYEPMLKVLDAALTEPTADKLRKLEPFLQRVTADQLSRGRAVLVACAVGIAAFVWFAVR